MGGTIIKIIKPDREQESEIHLSEIETQRISDSLIDIQIINDTTIEDFHVKIQKYLDILLKLKT